MKAIRIFLLGIGLLALSASRADAQVFTPPTSSGGNGGSGSGGNGGGGSGSGGGSSSSSSNTTTIDNQSGGSQGNDQVLGNDAPFFDPTTEVFSFDGKQFNVNDNRVFRARFEKYLNAEAATSEEDRAYRSAIREILDILSPHNRGSGKLPKAVAKLQHAAQFPQDARLCESLANAVYRIYLARESAAELQRLNEDLADQRRQLDWNFDRWKDDRGKPNTNSDEKENAKEPDPPKAGRMQRYVQRIAELESQRVANKAKMELTEVQAKTEFQALVVQLFLQRRFQHVVMGARLYTEFFQDGDGKLKFEEGSEVEKTFSKTIGFNPTITTLDTFANEAIRDVGQSAESFGYLLERDEIDGALRQLQQAFVTGQHLPAVQRIPREDKRAVLGYAQNAFQLTSALEVKDYARAEKLVAKMEKQASDFDPSKPTAAIESAKLSSNMRIRTAKNAALDGDEQEYEENIQAAAEIWPTNPSLEEQFNLIADSADRTQQAKLEFDRLLGTQSYRQIFDNKARFIAATVDDPERQEDLQEVVGNVQEIETVLKQAETLEQAGNDHAAWELVEKTFQRFPDDVPLSAKRSDLATGVAPFVKALRTAESLEEQEQYGSSLAWYLSARRIYPQSDLAAGGIDRLVDRILPNEGAGDSGELSAADSPAP